MEHMILQDICKIYDCPHTTAKDEGIGIPLVRTPNVGKGRLNLMNVHRVNSDIYKQRTLRAIPEEDDIIIAREAPVGNAAIIQKGQKVCLGQRVVLLKTIKDLVDPNFLVYYLLSNEVQHQLRNHSNGAVVAHLNVADIRNLPVNLPTLNEQKRIGRFLKKIDDKISVNKKICENLEAQAQALFKHWFIDFAPFKDGKFVESELGMIPEGWRVGTLTEIADYMNGLAMQKFPPTSVEDSIPVLKIKELGQSMCDSNSDRCSKLIKPEYIINNGDIIFSWSGTLLVDIWCGGVCGLNQHLFKVSSKEYPKWFYLMWTKHHLGEFIRIAKDKAVTMGHIKRGDLEKAKVAIPGAKDMGTISPLMEELLDKIVNCRLESSRLSTLRDTLLPRLMSGQIKL